LEPITRVRGRVHLRTITEPAQRKTGLIQRPEKNQGLEEKGYFDLEKTVRGRPKGQHPLKM